MNNKRTVVAKGFVCHNLVTTGKCIGPNHNGRYKWECICKCGATTWQLANTILKRNIQSCGCILREKAKTKSGTSDRTGVFWENSRKLWNAWIMKDRKRVHLGRYEKYDDACAARTKAEIEILGYSKQ